MPVARPESSDARVIAHVDMDCFYVQVEQRKQPALRGVPTAVVQYNAWKGGGLIAVGYEARKFGVKRSMRGDEAKKACPEIHLVQVPVARGKADLNIYRNAGSEVVSILSRRGRCERASIDEVYLDLTDAAETMLSENPPETLEAIDEEALKSHVLGLNQSGNEKVMNVREWLCRSDADHRDKLLACGAFIVAELRIQVLKETEFTCSAGIAHNKMLAKLASGMNKPAQQTIVPSSAVKELLASLPIKKMKQLGGKLGSSVQNDLHVHSVGDLLQFSEEKLQGHYGVNTGTWLWNVARGISGDEVEGRLLPKSHGCGKTFPGPQALKTIASVESWLNDLSEELSERIQSDFDTNKRVAHTLTLHARAYKTNDSDSHKKFPSRSCPLRYGTPKIQEDAMKLFDSGLREFLSSYRIDIQGNQSNTWGVTALSISASKILFTTPGTSSILKFFQNKDPSCSSEQPCDEVFHNTLLLGASGTENGSELDKNEAEKTEINCIRPLLDQEEQKKEIPNHKGTSSILKFFHSQDPSCSSSKQPCNEVFHETLPLVTSGTENRSELNKNEAEETVINCIGPLLGREEQKIETPNHKGTNSILRFFQTQSSSGSSSQQACNGLSGDNIQSSSTSCVPNINNDRSKWSFNVEDIDPSVVDELPPEIQDEIRGLLRPVKRANTAKRGSSISHYFSPSKRK